MSYNTMLIKKDGLPELDCVSELYEIKNDILSNEQHKGKNFEIVFHAYCQIKQFYGKPKPSTLCKSGCIKQMNDILKNWFKAYEMAGGTIPTDDKRSPIAMAMSANQGGSLVSLETRRKNLEAMDYGDLKEELKSKIGEEAYKKINGKKPAKKVQIVEELIKL